MRRRDGSSRWTNCWRMPALRPPNSGGFPGSSNRGRTAVAASGAPTPGRETSNGTARRPAPNYVRLLEHGDAQDVGDTMAVGDESSVLARLRRYRNAGVTDLAVRVVPLGPDVRARGASRRRTQEFAASLFSELA